MSQFWELWDNLLIILLVYSVNLAISKCSAAPEHLPLLSTDSASCLATSNDLEEPRTLLTEKHIFLLRYHGLCCQ